MAKGFFVTGTDTGVGKTIIAAALIKAIGILGSKTCGMKPIETGCSGEGGALMPSDGMFLKTVARMDEPVSRVTPCCLRQPLAPMVSAEAEGTTINLEKIKKAFYEFTKTYESIVVEGIGGLFVPIKRDYFVFDLAKEFGLPLIVVARPNLGTINHTLLTINYALKEGLRVAGIIINYTYPAEGSMAEETNPLTIKQLSPVPLMGVFPYLNAMSDEALEKTAMKNLDINIIRRYIFEKP